MFNVFLSSNSKLLFAVMSFTIIHFSSIAQTSTAFELNEYLSSTVKQAQITTKTKQAETATVSLESLVYDLHPTAFIQGGEIKTFGDPPAIKAEVNSLSFDLFKSTNLILNEVELLIIKFNDPGDINTSFDFSENRDFTRLRYIYVQCPFECNQSQIEKMIRNLPQGVTLLYSVSNPE